MRFLRLVKQIKPPWEGRDRVLKKTHTDVCARNAPIFLFLSVKVYVILVF